MNILKQKRDFFQSLFVFVPPQAKKLFQFGCETLILRDIASLRRSARRSALNWNTAKAKIYRLTINHKIFSIFTALLVHLGLVSSQDTVAIDFSDFGEKRQVLMFAKQTKKGRALPLYFEILQYPIEKDSQNLFVIEAIKHFTAVIGCKPRLVFDRGFACPSLIKFLAKNQYIFVIRLKRSKQVIHLGKVVKTEKLSSNDCRVTAYGLPLRLIVSDLPTSGEPWYLVTNDLTATRDAIIDIYYHRFEIEEFFRDTKRVMGMEYLQTKKVESLRVILCFAVFAAWFADKVEQTLAEAQVKEKLTWQVSTFRYVWESLEKEILSAAESYFMSQLGEEICV